MKWGTDEVEIPPLRASNNGWYYSYDGETLARGNSGRRMAQDLADERVRRILTEHDWEVPDEVYPKHVLPYENSGLQAWVDHPGYGPVRIRYIPRDDTMSVSVHPLLIMIERHRNGTHPDRLTLASKMSPTVSPHEVARNIWEYGRRFFPVLTLIETPEIKVRYRLNSRDEWVQQDGSFTVARDSTSYFMSLTDEQLEAARGDRIEDLISLFGVYGHRQVRASTVYAPDRNGYGTRPVTVGVEIVVRGEGDEEDHTIHIKSSGEASVRCGYRDSEHKYLEYQKRQLAGWMQEELGVAGDEFEEFTFD